MELKITCFVNSVNSRDLPGVNSASWQRSHALTQVAVVNVVMHEYNYCIAEQC